MRKLIRSIIGVAATMAWVAPLMPCIAQHTASIVGNHVVHFPPVGVVGNITENPLPVPDDPVALANGLTYAGELPQHSQYVQLDDRGRVLFFIIDGDVFDRDGYLIARRSAEIQGSDSYPFLDGLVKEGRGELVVAPVPDRCGAWYLIHSRRPTSAAPHILGFSILDLGEHNTLFPDDEDRHGRLLDQTSMFDEGYGGFADDFDLNPYLGDQTRIPDDPGLARNGPVKLKVAHDPGTGRSLLLVSTGYWLAKYELRSNGIEFLDVDPIVQNPQLEPIYQTAQGEIEAHVSGSLLVVGLSYDLQRLINTPEQSYAATVPHVYITELDLTSANLDQEGLPTIIAEAEIQTGNDVEAYDAMGRPVHNPTIGGLEFSASGRYVYWIKSYPGGVNDYLGCWDRITNLELPFADISMLPFVTGKLERHGDETGHDALYVSGTKADGTHILGALPNPDSPDPTAWIPEVFTTSSNTLCADASLEDPNATSVDPYHLLDKRMLHDRTLPMLAQAVCCETLLSITGYTNYEVEAGNHLWTATNNPFNDLAEVRVSGVLRITSGANVVANDITFKFAPGASLVIERGAFFSGETCTFTNGCEGRLAGIRVEGTSTDPSNQNSAHGQLLLSTSTVENATTGVWCARTDALSNTDPNYYGGWVRAYSSTFRNCLNGVHIERFQRMSSQGAVLPQLSTFTNCTFVTDAGWPDHEVNFPHNHVVLIDVQGVRFTHCEFRNDISSSFPVLLRGWGIWAFAAGFDVTGSTVEEASLFEGLSAGIVAHTGAARKANIRQTWFEQNFVGAVLQDCTGPEVSRCHFEVPSSTGDVLYPTGLILHGSTAYLVEENDFQGGGLTNMNVGLLIRGDVRDPNRIYNNTFNALWAGTYTNDRQKGYDPNQGQEFAGLRLFCSDYTDCGYEHLLGDNTYIDAAQGEWSGSAGLSQLAANRFFNGGFPGIRISTVQPQGANAPFFNYIRHDVPECDPHDDGNPYFNDIRIDQATDFTKSVACGNGYLPDIGGGGGVSGYRLAAAQLRSVKANFAGTVDVGEKVDIVEAIKQRDPVLASHTLRDYLLARCPLSDETLLEVIYREEPMDPWHLTQVMLGNAKLTPKVLDALERSELLNTYMFGLVRNAGSGPTVKDLLQQELDQRSAEKARYLVLALDELLADSTRTAPADSLYAMLAHAPDGSDYYNLARIALAQGDHDLALAWLDSLVAARDPGQDLLRELVEMNEQLGGDWQQADAGQRARLAQLADKKDPGSALAWAIRYHLGETKELPLLPLPVTTKRYYPGPLPRAAATVLPVVQAHPNPTTGRSMVVIGAVVDEVANLHVSDPSGRVVRTLPVTANQQLLELDLSGLADGLYVIELLVGDMKLGATKLTLQH